MRPVLIFVAALLALSGSVITALATQGARDFALRGYADATQSDDLPYRVPRLGVNADLLQYAADELAQHLDWMQRANVRWVRQFAYWDQLEPQQGAYDWSNWDEIVAAVDDYADMRLLVVFMHTPAWARPERYAEQTTIPPADPADLAAFTQAFAQRYGDSIDHYQIWDEPNLDDAWGLTQPNPAQYAALLQAGYDAIHSADERATVLAAALAPTTETGGMNLSDILYLERMYALGAANYMDAVAAKPYGFDHTPDDRLVHNDRLNFSRMIALREVMQANGDGRKALWAGNWGWNALPADWSGAASIWGQVSPQQQINYTLQALDRAEREWPWLGGMILHHWQPNAPADSAQWGFALINQDGEPTALWQALVQRQIPQAATNGLHHPITPYARYSGVWTFGDLGADIGWLETSDSQLEFDFIGRDVALHVREGDYSAFLYPTTDGQPANATPRDSSGTPYIHLRSASDLPELNTVAVARDLAHEQHTLRIITDKGWDQWAIAGYAVSGGNLAAPYNTQIAYAWLSAGIAAIAVLISAWRVQWGRVAQPLMQVLRRVGDVSQLFIGLITSLAMLVGMLLTFGDGLPALFRRDALQLGVLIVLSGGLIALEPGLVLTIIAALVLFVLIFNRILHGLLLTLLFAPFFLFPVELYTFAFPMSELLLLITFAAWALRMLMQWGQRRRAGQPLVWPALYPLDYALAAWLALGIVSLLWANDAGRAITELRTLMLEPFLFYVMLRSLKPSQRDVLCLVDTLLLAGLLVALIGLFLYVRGDAIITAEAGARRLASVYGSPNNVGLFLGRCLPFALAFVFIPTDRNRRIFASITALILLLALALTQSVGALLLGVPAGIAVVTWLVYRRRALLPLGALAALGAAIIGILTQVSARFASLLDLSTGTNFLRLRVWESALAIIRDNPITGLGLDQFLYAYRGHYIRPDAIWDSDLSHPHNFILDFWIRLSVFGVLVFVWLQMVFWSAAWKAYITLSEQNTYLYAVIVGVMGSMANLLAHGLVDNSVYVNDLAYVFVLLLALVRLVVAPQENVDGENRIQCPAYA